MLVIVTSVFVMFVILGMIVAVSPRRRMRNNFRHGDGQETNLNIRALIDDPWKKR